MFITSTIMDKTDLLATTVFIYFKNQKTANRLAIGAKEKPRKGLSKATRGLLLGEVKPEENAEGKGKEATGTGKALGGGEAGEHKEWAGLACEAV